MKTIWLETATSIMNKAKELGVNLVLPTDCVAADSFSNEAKTQICQNSDIPAGWMGLDLGPDSVKKLGNVIKSSKTILWNGPAGVFEFSNFEAGSRAIAQAIVDATAAGAFSLIGGGDSVACINKFGMADQGKLRINRRRCPARMYRRPRITRYQSDPRIRNLTK